MHRASHWIASTNQHPTKIIGDTEDLKLTRSLTFSSHTHTHTPAHPLPGSLTHSITHSRTHSLTRSLTHSQVTHSPVHLLTRSPAHPLLTHSRTRSPFTRSPFTRLFLFNISCYDSARAGGGALPVVFPIIRSSRNPRLPQLQPLSARYNLIPKNPPKRHHHRAQYPPRACRDATTNTEDPKQSTAHGEYVAARGLRNT